MRLCNIITKSNAFSSLIVICISLAAVLVGMQTYQTLQDNKILSLLDHVLFYIFAFECLLKLFAKGSRQYFTGPEWRWNIFDFTTVLLCMPFFHLGDSGVYLLRLLRLLRVNKLIKEVPQLEILVGGLAKGLVSTPYTVALVLLVFYMFGVAAVFFFGANDPAQFGDLGIALITLFRCATLEDWTDVMYINMFGCDVYDGGLYTRAESNQPVHSVFGTFKGFQCTAPSQHWLLSVAYFVCFIIFSAFVLLSLFIGAITMGMSEAVEVVRIQQFAEDNLKKVDPDWFKELVDNAFVDPAGEKQEEFSPSSRVQEDRVEKTAPKDGMGGDPFRNPSSVASLKAGKGVLPLHTEIGTASFWRWRALWAWQGWSSCCARVLEHPWFQGFLVFVALAASVLVVLSTRFENALLTTLDNTITFVFVFELVAKFCSDQKNPLCFFKDTWNVFDFTIVAGSIAFLLLTPNHDAARMIRMFWLLRILRSLRLIRFLPRLRILIEVLVNCCVSLAYLCVLIMLVFFFFAVLGMVMFETNDPWHYGTLHRAILTLFRISTLEDWTDVMFINQYGCNVYGWHVYPILSDCSPRAMGYWSVLFHVVFVTLGTMVLTNTFLGTVVSSMLQAARAQRREQQLDQLAQKLAKERGMPISCVKTLQKGFLLFDLDYGGSIDVMEVFPLFLALCPDATDEQLANLFLAAEKDDSGSIDFDEFIDLVLLLR
ncbi:unnamed protein product, partial [Heterosigma akashiwo]